MSLTSSLYSGVTGLATHGNAMSVIGDNISNTNTIGFKSSRTVFQDVLSQAVATSTGSAQVGRGSTLGDISSAFSQGSFESTESTTDLAIGGDGFFVVRHPENPNETLFTRAGNFRFDKDGFFSTPGGHVAKGWALRRNAQTLDVEDVGALQDIRLDSFTSPPEQTDKVSVVTVLQAEEGHDFTVSSAAAPNALSSVWQGAHDEGTHIESLAYEYQTTVKVYDSLGSTHDVTVYFDQGPINQNGEKTYEYIVTTTPTEDKRDIFTNASGAGTDNGYGMLGRGLLTFSNAGGGIIEQTFEKFVGTSGNSAADSQIASAIVNESAQNFTAPSAPTVQVFGQYTGVDSGATPAQGDIATFSFPQGGVIGGLEPVTVNVTYASGAGGPYTFVVPPGYTSGTVLGEFENVPDGLKVSFETGEVNANDSFQVDIQKGDGDNLLSDFNWSKQSKSLYDLENQHFTFDPDFLGAPDGTTQMKVELDFGADFSGNIWNSGPLSTVSVSSASTTITQSASGYGSGDLQTLNVDPDGVITGQYSNGQVAPLFRVALAKFQNAQELFKVGGSLFKETRLSGAAITNRPGSGGVGSIAANSLEQSNVDIAQEFVKMITTQRGFQANSKIVTTVDQMLSDTISMKR
jgi:flagellar hook protein FlgE